MGGRVSGGSGVVSTLLAEGGVAGGVPRGEARPEVVTGRHLPTTGARGGAPRGGGAGGRAGGVA